MGQIIEVKSVDKITTLRVTEKTKHELESFGSKGETHEGIIKKLMHIAQNTLNESSSQIFKRNNVIGTKYSRLSKILTIATDTAKHTILCNYNDLSFMSVIRNKRDLREQLTGEWELDLEIINISTDAAKFTDKKKIVTWRDPKIFQKHDPTEFSLLYLVAVKNVLEEMFSVKIYELVTQEDYFNPEKWRKAYLRNNFSMESFDRDIEKKLR